MGLFAMDFDIVSILNKLVRQHQVILEKEQYVARRVFRHDDDPLNLLTAEAVGHLQGEDAGKDAGILRDEDIPGEQNILLLGSAGAGKSLIMRRAYCSAVDRYLADTKGPIPLWLDIPQVPSDRDIGKALDARNDGLWAHVKDARIAFVIFFDSLDERNVSHVASEVRTDLETFFLSEVKNEPEQPENRVAVACRRSQCRLDWFSAPGVKLTRYSADFMEDSAFEAILGSSEKVHSLHEAASKAGIGNLLENAFDGFALTRQFKEHGELPRNRTEIISSRVESHLQGHEEDREGAACPSVDLLRRISRTLACHVVFSMEDASFAEQEAINSVNADYGTTFSPQVVKAALSRPLFRRDANTFSFSHLLYIEYLVAEELKTLPLPRQRQLLDSSLSHCYGRVRTSFRGIASFLTYSSDQFRYQVLKHDPVTLFVSDSGNLPIAEVDELVRAVVRNCIAHHLTPWTELRPHGYRYGFYLPRWRPADPGAVVRGLMSQPESDAKGWAASCARAWGVTATFAAEFARVALDESAPLWVRRVMIEAVGDSKSQETALSIRPLCSHSNDVLRIHAIEVVCENCELSPEESLGFYLTPATDRHYRDMYADYARKLGRNLACRDAFASAIVFISERFKEMKDFWQDLVLGPLEKARDASYDNVPPHLLYQILGSWNDEVTEELKLAATDLLRSSTQLLFRLWQYVLEGIADSTTDIYSHQIKNTFAELMTPELLPEIGKIGPDAHRYQALMVREVLQAWLGLEPTAHRLAFIQSTFPRFVSEIRLPRPLQRPCVDIPALESTIEGIAADVTATTDLQDVAGRISDIRRLTKAERAKIDHLPRRLDESSNESGIDEITASLYAQFTDDLRTGIRNLCLTTILRIIEELEHDSRKTTLAMLDETVRLHYEAGGSLPADGSDLAKVVMWSRAGESFYRARLAELRTNNVQLWQESVCQMMETPCGAEHALVQAMIQGNDPFYAERALDRLRRGELDAPVEYELIELVAHFLPDGTRELLRSYSLGLKPVPEQGALKRNSGDLALRVLLASDDDTAWEVIEAMLEGGECPLVDDWHHDFTIAPHRERVPVLCKWMVALLRDRQSGHALGLLEKMKAAIRSIGGREAVLAWIFHGP